MRTFRRELLAQIEQIEKGKIFTFRDLSFPQERLANVAVLLSGLTKRGELVRVEKGAYYRPRESKLGLGKLPVFQEEQFQYITRKLGGYITGAYIYNKLGLTEQVATTITIATRKPTRRFRFKNLEIECVKAYSEEIENAETLTFLRILDAIKDLKHIPGRTEQDVYDQIKKQYVMPLPLDSLNKIVSLSVKYPPRVRKVLCDMFGDLHFVELQSEVFKTILPTTRFELNYRRA